MNNNLELDKKDYKSGRAIDDKLSECPDKDLKLALPNDLDLSSLGPFQNSCDFSGFEPFRKGFYAQGGGGFSNSFSSFAGEASANNFDASGQNEYFKDLDSFSNGSLLEYVDTFMRNTFSNNSKFAAGFPVIFVGAEAYQVSMMFGISLVIAGISLLGIGQYYRECPEGLDG